MTRITVLGGTGYAGGNLVKVAAEHGHKVVSYSRSVPSVPVDGVDYRTGDVLEDGLLSSVVDGAEVVISALSPRGALEGAGRLRAIQQKIAGLALQHGIRFGVIGGAGSLLVAEGGPKLAETDGFPAEFAAEAAELDGVLEDLRAGDQGLDWFFVSPAAAFGPWAPGEPTGVYRTGGDVLLADADGQSNISGPDLAHAVVSEIERPAHSRSRFTIAY